jgi:hypothetical protein
MGVLFWERHTEERIRTFGDTDEPGSIIMDMLDAAGLVGD